MQKGETLEKSELRRWVSGPATVGLGTHVVGFSNKVHSGALTAVSWFRNHLIQMLRFWGPQSWVTLILASKSTSAQVEHIYMFY